MSILALYRRVLTASKICLFVCVTMLAMPRAFAQVPTITGFSPTSGAVGATVTITGTNFSTTAASNTVFFGGVKATVSSASATSLSVTVPAGATYQPITVTTGALTAASNVPFVTTFTTNAGQTFGTASFAPAVSFSSNTGGSIDNMLTSDLDGNGKLDLAVVNGTKVSVYRNTSTGAGNISFAGKQDIDVSSNITTAKIADINGDGKPDLIAATNTQVIIYRNTSASGAIQQFSG